MEIDYDHLPNCITKEELDRFQNLKNIRAVFDVGAKNDDFYYQLKPKAKYHLFEPNPKWFEELRIKLGDKPNVLLNNYGLGDIEGNFHYDNHLEGFSEKGEDNLLPIKTLDWYIKEYKIKRIDFLKIDAEQWDYKVLLGGKKALEITKYLQYEYWDDKEKFEDLLKKDFHLEEIENRNVFGTRL